MTPSILYCARFVIPITATVVEDGAVLVEDGKIRSVDTRRQLVSAHPDAKVVNFGDSVLLPPMVNAHTHLELSMFNEWATAAGEPVAPQDFVDWVLWLVRVKRQVSLKQLQRALAEGLKQSLLAGTGAIGDILTSLDAATAYQRSPLYGQVFAEVLGQDPDLIERRLADIDGISRSKPSASLDWGLSPHAPYTLSSSLTDQVFAFAERRALQCAIHLAESKAESTFLFDGSGPIAETLYAAAKWDPMASTPPGCSPVKALCRQGRLKRTDMAVHGVQVDRTDIDLLKQSGCSVVLCPRSNAALKVGKAPVAAYLQAGVSLALGTDSIASSASLSIWDELAFAYDWFKDEVSPGDWLNIATHGGAKALGLQDRIGQLTPGRDASFQVVTLPQMPRLDLLEETLCRSGQSIKVTHLYLAAENVLPQS